MSNNTVNGLLFLILLILCKFFLDGYDETQLFVKQILYIVIGIGAIFLLAGVVSKITEHKNVFVKCWNWFNNSAWYWKLGILLLGAWGLPACGLDKAAEWFVLAYLCFVIMWMGKWFDFSKKKE